MGRLAPQTMCLPLGGFWVWVTRKVLQKSSGEQKGPCKARDTALLLTGPWCREKSWKRLGISLLLQHWISLIFLRVGCAWEPLQNTWGHTEGSKKQLVLVYNPSSTKNLQESHPVGSRGYIILIHLNITTLIFVHEKCSHQERIPLPLTNSRIFFNNEKKILPYLLSSSFTCEYCKLWRSKWTLNNFWLLMFSLT